MRSLGLGLAAALAVTAAQARPADEPAREAVWHIVTAQTGEVIGHASEEIVQKPDGREIIGRQQLSLKEVGKPPSRVSGRSVVKEDRTGRTVSITDTSRTGRDWARIEARILADRAEVVRVTPSERRTVVVPLPAGVRFDGGEGLLPGWDPAATPKLEFEHFDADGMVVERVVIEAAPAQAGDPPDTRAAVRRRYTGRDLRSVARLAIDASGRIVSVTQPMFGSSVTVRVTDRATALAPHPPYAVLPRLMTKSPFRISPTALRGHIRYRFAFSDGLSFDLPQTGEQRATATPGGVILDICETCGPGYPEDPATLAEAKKPTVWLQSDDRRIRAIAAPVAKMRVTDARKMELLSLKARPYLGRVDFTGHFSAVETLSRRAGDCTEAAVLLAALGRAAGIPTKVANGLVYSRERYHGVSNAFMPHSWTLAYVDGEWRSFDAALDVFDASHIAFNIGDGEARSVMTAGQLASLLRWQEMAEVKTRPQAR